MAVFPLESLKTWQLFSLQDWMPLVLSLQIRRSKKLDSYAPEGQSWYGQQRRWRRQRQQWQQQWQWHRQNRCTYKQGVKSKQARSRRFPLGASYSWVACRRSGLLWRGVCLFEQILPGKTFTNFDSRFNYSDNQEILRVLKGILNITSQVYNPVQVLAYS